MLSKLAKASFLELLEIALFIDDANASNATLYSSILDKSKADNVWSLAYPGYSLEYDWTNPSQILLNTVSVSSPRYKSSNHVS